MGLRLRVMAFIFIFKPFSFFSYFTLKNFMLEFSQELVKPEC